MSSLFIYKRERHINIVMNDTNSSSTYIVRTVHAIPKQTNNFQSIHGVLIHSLKYTIRGVTIHSLKYILVISYTSC